MKLLQPFQSATLDLKNHMVMAAMTRSRGAAGGVATDLMKDYYTQRASAGLIITEAIDISEDAIGSPFTTGLYTQAQVEAWHNIVDSVHQAGGKIFAQLWHTGRVSHSLNRGGKLPHAPSAIKIEGMQHFTIDGMQDYETPIELTVDEIHQVQDDFVQAAKNAMQAGFDGVEFHMANGYLPQQFLSDSANVRTDNYGGSIENKARFTLEILDRMIDAIGKGKVGIKISPLHPYAGITFDNPMQTYTYLINELNKRDLAFVELMRRSPMFPLLAHYPKDDEMRLFGSQVKHTLIAGTAYTRESAEQVLQDEVADLVAFGSAFLANPDLPVRFEKNAPLNEADRATMFGGDQKGYTDYPFLS